MNSSNHQLTGARAVLTLVDLGAASIAAGVIARRRRVVRILERVQADTRAVTRMQALRREFGRGPVELVLPGRRILVVTDPEDVQRVLTQEPEPFHPANREKRKALQWFQPHGVLISAGPIRLERRVFNEDALDAKLDFHHLAPAFNEVIGQEMTEVAEHAIRDRQLDSDMFMRAWWRLVRRLTLGLRARDDEDITDRLLRLRQAGNWSFLSFPHYRQRAKFYEDLYRYVEDPEIATLASSVANLPTRAGVDPVGQMPQWLFAFDAAGMAALRALALLTTHPSAMAQARAEAESPEVPSLRPFLRSSVLESVRLWPTTPTILRDTTTATEWRSGSERFTVAAGTGLMIVTPAFHRDDELLPFAHRFAPEIWMDGTAATYPQLVPFSGGPAVCPGRNLVLFVVSATLAHLVDRLDLQLRSGPSLDPDAALPLTFNQYGVAFDVHARVDAAVGSR